MRASCWIFAQHEPGKFTKSTDTEALRRNNIMYMVRTNRHRLRQAPSKTQVQVRFVALSDSVSSAEPSPALVATDPPLLLQGRMKPERGSHPFAVPVTLLVQPTAPHTPPRISGILNGKLFFVFDDLERVCSTSYYGGTRLFDGHTSTETMPTLLQ